MNLETHFLNKLNSYSLSSGRLGIALSGGLDSIALLHIANNTKKKHGLELFALHVNHNLRGVGLGVEEEDFLKNLCNQLNIPLYVHTIAPGILEADKRGIELAAREERYSFFEQFLNASTIIATAHHQDDQLETVLMRLFDGAGLKGLSGIPEVNGDYIRPLLNISRQAIEEYADSLSFLQDHSNFELKYRRNIVRHKILPIIEEFEPRFRQNIERFTKNMVNYADFIDTSIDHRLFNKSSKSFLYKDFYQLHKVQQQEFLFYVFDVLHKKTDKKIRFKHIEAVINSILNKKNITFGNYRIMLNDESVFFEPLVVQKKKKGYLYKVGSMQEVHTPIGAFSFYRHPDCLYIRYAEQNEYFRYQGKNTIVDTIAGDEEFLVVVYNEEIIAILLQGKVIAGDLLTEEYKITSGVISE